MNRKWIVGFLGAAALLVATDATATVPQTFSVQGVLRDKSGNLVGATISTTKNVSVNFYAAKDGTTPVYSTPVIQAGVTGGLFTVKIDVSTLNAAQKTAFATPPLFLEVVAGDDTFPRQEVTPDVYALMCGNADTVTNGVYTTGDQSISGAKIFTSTVTLDNTSNMQVGCTGTKCWTANHPNGKIGFLGYGVSHGQISYYPEFSAFAFLNSSTHSVLDDNGPLPTPAQGYVDIYAGQVHNTGTPSLSDARLKTDVAPLRDALQTLKQLRGVSFKWKKDGTPAIGFIAQEVESTIPEIVSTDPRGYKSVDYVKVVPILTEALKEQDRTLAEVRAENVALRERLERLERRLDAIAQSPRRAGSGALVSR
jgi:hypothetical protein